MANTTYVLVPGAGGNPRYWSRVLPLLHDAGHHAVAVDLPNWPGATLTDQGDAIVTAGRGADEVVLVAQSMGGFSAALACDRVPVIRLVLTNAMIPAPAETAGDWWAQVGQPKAVRENDIGAGRDPDAGFDLHTVFLHDLPPDLVAELMAQSDDDPATTIRPSPCSGSPSPCPAGRMWRPTYCAVATTGCSRSSCSDGSPEKGWGWRFRSCPAVT